MMPGVIDHASAMLSASEGRLRAAALNLSNASTAGYKRQVAFSAALEGCAAAAPCLAEPVWRFDFSQGQLRETGQPLDLAIDGPGLFQLREGERIVYSRGGSFSLREGGTLADAAGRLLQQAGGGDLIVSDGAAVFLEDGTVLEDGLPATRLALFEAADPEALRAAGGSSFIGDPALMEEAQRSAVRAGFLESSNVLSSDEMISVLAAVRSAESGARVAQFYDRLMGQAISRFGGGSQ